MTFAFVDEYNNFLIPYFMIKGRQIYSQIFLNHQVLPIYLSYLIQVILKPNSLYRLILYHRLFMIGFSMFCSLLLVMRFKKKALIFVIIYELLKYYFFGHLFQAEGMIVYALVYLFFLLFEEKEQGRLIKIDYLFIPFTFWFILFSREPAAPAACLLMLFLFIKKLKKSPKLFIMIGLFVLLTLVTFIKIPLKEYIYSLFNVNMRAVVDVEVSSEGGLISKLFKALFYPFFIPFSTQFSQVYLVFNLAFLAFLELVILLFKKNKSFILFSILILMVVNLRFVEPARLYYRAYRLLPWLALFIAVLIMAYEKLKKHINFQNYRLSLNLAFFIALSVLMIHPLSFLREKHDLNYDYTTNYLDQYLVGEVVRILAKPGDRFFVNDYDSLSFYQSGLDSSYRYALYYPVMPGFQKYQQAFDEMYFDYPPSFTDTGSCDPIYSPNIPVSVVGQYFNLTKNGLETCLFIKKSVLANSDQQAWQQVQALGYSPDLKDFTSEELTSEVMSKFSL